jgi:mannan endo-1,4-beta-mannosidase
MHPLRTSVVACTALWAVSGCLKQAGPRLAAGAQPQGPCETCGIGPHEIAPAEGPVEETHRPVATFILEGQPFCFAGANSYYPMYKSKKMVDDLFDTASRLGLRVIRIWAFLDRGSLDGAVPDVHPPEKEGVYFQYWDPILKHPAYNDSETGLSHLDYVLDKARRLDLKVILVLTNNWRDFGGMDQYLTWYGLTEHRQFYTDASVTRAYQDWLAHLVQHRNTVNGALYRDDPTIFAWELANEPRCTNGGVFDNRPGCTPQMIVRWSRLMSSFIKSLDPNHLVSVGDEGFFVGGHGFGRDGAQGVDHAGLLALEQVDFGTFHLYPDNWAQSPRWGDAWIADHIEAAREAGKPTVLEEYGLVARRNRAGAIVDDARRGKIYPRWHELIEKGGGNGGLFWMLAGYDDEYGRYPDYDRFALYSDDSEAMLIRNFAAEMTANSRACRLFRQFSAPDSAPKSAFVTVARPPGWSQPAPTAGS